MTAIVRLGEILRAAIAREDLHRVRELLERGAPPNERGDHGTTALHWAAAADECEMVRALLQAGADPNARAADGCTPLHYAAREDAVRSVATLLDHGADPSVANDASRVPADEIYDNQDDPDGVEIARALAEATRRAADDDDAPGRARPRTVSRRNSPPPEHPRPCRSSHSSSPWPTCPRPCAPSAKAHKQLMTINT